MKIRLYMDVINGQRSGFYASSEIKSKAHDGIKRYAIDVEIADTSEPDEVVEGKVSS